MFLGRLLIGLAAAALGAVAVAVTVKCIKGVLDKKKLENLAMQDGINRALVESIERCNNKVTLKDLNSDRKITYQGDAISNDVRVGMVI